LKVTRRVRIRGVVQGVGYRASLARQARQLDIRGWVRNRVDGSVEATIQGPALDVEALLDWCRRGPPAARVDSVEHEPDEGEFVDFDTLATG